MDVCLRHPNETAFIPISAIPEGGWHTGVGTSGPELEQTWFLTWGAVEGTAERGCRAIDQVKGAPVFHLHERGGQLGGAEQSPWGPGTCDSG